MSFRPNLAQIGVERRLHWQAAPGMKPKVTLGRVLEQARPCWKYLFGIVLLSFFSTPFALLLPLPLKLVVDNVIGQRPTPEILDRWFPAAWTHSTSGLLMIAAVFLLILGGLMQLQVL